MPPGAAPSGQSPVQAPPAARLAIPQARGPGFALRSPAPVLANNALAPRSVPDASDASNCAKRSGLQAPAPDKTLSGLSVELILVWARSVLWSSLAALGTESEGQVCPNRCATGRRWVPALPAEATSQRLAVWATLEPVWFTRWRSLSWQVNKSWMGFFFLQTLPCLPSWVVLFVRTVLNFLVRHFGSVRTELGLLSQVLESLAASTLIRQANFNMQDRQLCYRVTDPKNI